MFDLSGKFSEFKDKISGKKSAEKEGTPAPLTDQNYIQEAAWLMRKIADNSRVDFREAGWDDRELLAAYCYGALAGFDRDYGERAKLVHGAMHNMLTRKFHFPESHAQQLIKQLQGAREQGGNERLLQMIRRGERYYALLREGKEHSAAGDAEAAFCLSLFEAKDDLYIAPPGDERIREFEEAHGVSFPEEYIRFLKEYNGAAPVKGGFDCCGVTYYVERFLPLLDKAGVAEMRLAESREAVEKLLPLEMDAVIRQYADRITEDLDLEEMYYIPIARLSGGNLACLDFGVYPDPPTVCIWLEEESEHLYPVLVEAAQSFAGFLSRLYLIRAAVDQEQDAFCREYFYMVDTFADLAGLCLETAREEERLIFAAYCFGALYSFSKERGAELFRVQAAEIALLVQRFDYDPQESAQLFGVFVQVAGGEDASLAKEAISRGMVDFYVLKGGENGLAERNIKELLRSARELMTE